MPRDKFAAMASRAENSNASGESSQSTPAGTAQHTSPRRDKLAALAASQQASASKQNSSPAASRGNSKLAAMAAATSNSPPGGGNGSRGNSKLAAMAAATSLAAATAALNVEQAKKESYTAKLKERMSKRRQIFENLDRAEDLTCKLLEIVHKTTTAMQDLSSSSPDLAQLSREYRKTLQEIHPLLSTGTEELVQPYQNHSTEAKQSMYAARVEMRLARERTDVLKAFSEVEREEQNGRTGLPASTTTGNKRPREEDS